MKYLKKLFHFFIVYPLTRRFVLVGLVLLTACHKKKENKDPEPEVPQLSYEDGNGMSKPYGGNVAVLRITTKYCLPFILLSNSNGGQNPGIPITKDGFFYYDIQMGNGWEIHAIDTGKGSNKDSALYYINVVERTETTGPTRLFRFVSNVSGPNAFSKKY